MEILSQIARSLQQGEDERVAELTRQAVEAGCLARDILDNGLIAGMNKVGDLFREQEIFLPDVLLAARAMYAGLDVIKPLMLEQKVEPLGRIAIGTVQGDLHDIGKNLVGIMLRGAGFDVIDLGNDVAPEKFVTTAEQEGCRVIGMSALLTTTMPAMKRTCDLLKARGLAGRVKIVVGGAPVTAEYAKQIGADAYAFDAGSAVDTVKQLIAGPDRNHPQITQIAQMNPRDAGNLRNL